MQFNYKNTANLSAKDLKSAAKKLAPYFAVLAEAAGDNLYQSAESSLALPEDKKLREESLRLVREKKDLGPQEMMVVGIGGSNLGCCAVYEALKFFPPAGPVRRSLGEGGGGVWGGGSGAQLSFLDTVHSRAAQEAAERLEWIFKNNGSVLINIISKSGTTTETIANARVLLAALRKVERCPTSLKWTEYVVVTTEPGSKLDIWAEQQGIARLPNPAQVGGRYSVFSAVGVFPLALAGVDIKKLHKGAAKMLALCLSPAADKNPALQSAVAIHKAVKSGQNIHDLFVFAPNLECLGKWYRQLAGESLGKDGQGFTPTVSMGSTDLHSMAQLYLGGPKDKFTTFVNVRHSQDIKIPAVDKELDNIIPELNKKSFNKVMAAIYEGAKQAYEKRKLPFVEVVFDKMNEEELGAFMQFKMIETMLLAQLMGVNAFDQPNVEEYKAFTRQILSKG